MFGKVKMGQFQFSKGEKDSSFSYFFFALGVVFPGFCSELSETVNAIEGKQSFISEETTLPLFSVLRIYFRVGIISVAHHNCVFFRQNRLN